MSGDEQRTPSPVATSDSVRSAASAEASSPGGEPRAPSPAANGGVPADLDEIKRKAREREEETARFLAMQAKVEEDLAEATATTASQTPASSAEADARSVFVTNVDFSTTPEELQAHFRACGTINRITILVDRNTGRPRGHAYVEFADPAHVANAMALNDSLFRNRIIKVAPKRTNVPAHIRGGFRGRGGAYRGGFRGRGAPRGARHGHFAPY